MSINQLPETKPSHDPGGKRSSRLPDGMIGAVKISDCGRYRHWLSREWGSKPDSVLFIGLNPSVATDERNDPTVTREIYFAKREGFEKYIKVNLLDFRATDPRTLNERGLRIRSEENLVYINDLVLKSKVVIVAWGNPDRRLFSYSQDVKSILKASNRKVYCLGTTKAGNPRHPLYLKSDSPLIDYDIN